MSTLKARLAEKIKANGPLSLADYMHAALSDPQDGYYMRRAPFGAHLALHLAHVARI